MAQVHPVDPRTPSAAKERSLLLVWREEGVRKKQAHFDAARRLERRHLLLGVPATILSTAVGTTVFTSVQQEKSSKAVLVVAAVLSILAAVLSSLQTFLNLDGKRKEHKDAYGRWATLIARIDIVLTRQPKDDEMEAIRKDLEILRVESPIAGEKTL